MAGLGRSWVEDLLGRQARRIITTDLTGQRGRLRLTGLGPESGLHFREPCHNGSHTTCWYEVRLTWQGRLGQEITA